jgi:hypothetical protein
MESKSTRRQALNGRRLECALPREVGFFLPPEPQRRYGPMPEDKLVLQTEDVLVHRHGFIYITDKNQGLWVLRYSGGQ